MHDGGHRGGELACADVYMGIRPLYVSANSVSESSFSLEPAVKILHNSSNSARESPLTEELAVGMEERPECC